MKLSAGSRGLRYRRASWPETRYIDILKVGRGFAKRVEGINENGRRVVFGTNEEDTDWVRMGSIVKMKRGRR